MPPVAIAWALLFVVAFSVIYRFFAWLGRWLRRKVGDAPAPAVAAVERPPVIERAPSPPPPAAPAAFVAPKAEAALAPSLIAEPAVPARAVPSPAPARDFAASVPADSADEPRKPLASTAVISARTAAMAVRTALAPSVAATLPRLKPSVEATVPPKPVEPLSVAPTIAEPLPPAAPPAVVAAAEPVVETASSEPEVAADALPITPDNRMRPSARLLARRIGAEAPALDIRLRDTRERRIQRGPRISRRTAPPLRGKELRVLTMKETPSRISARRADQTDRVISLRSRAPDATKVRTKIIGVPRLVLRVLEAPVSPA